jgi:histidine triad (HIT) family protein
MECIFCKIIKKEIQSQIVYEDDKVFAFLDIQPVNPGHTLVVPKKHSVNIFDIDEEELCEVYKAAKKLAPVIMKAVNAQGMNVSSNNGKVSGQGVMHMHVHMIPRFEGDGHKHWSHKKYNSGEAENIVKKMKELLKK